MEALNNFQKGGEQISTDDMAASVLKALKTRYNGRSSKHQTDLELACNSIELMRVNIQESFDKEINVIINKYLQVVLN